MKMTERTENGTFKKGVSGNPNGRPKSVPLDESAKKLIGTDPIKGLEWLVEAATTKAELRQACKDLADYKAPKQKSIEMKSKQDTQITISWLTAGQEEKKRIEQYKTIDAKVIDHESNESIITKDE